MGKQRYSHVISYWTSFTKRYLNTFNVFHEILISWMKGVMISGCHFCSVFVHARKHSRLSCNNLNQPHTYRGQCRSKHSLTTQHQHAILKIINIYPYSTILRGSLFHRDNIMSFVYLKYFINNKIFINHSSCFLFFSVINIAYKTSLRLFTVNIQISVMCT